MDSDTREFKSRGCCQVPSTYQKNDNIFQHSCCKLDAFNWLEDFNPVDENSRFDCIEVRFKHNRKDYYRVPEGMAVYQGDILAVESSPGHDIGIVTLTGETCRLQMIKKKADYRNPELKKVYRKARGTDIEKWISATVLENSTMVKTRQVVSELGLEMKINDVEYQGDKTKAIFYYTADERVDFRELIKILAEKFQTRIEMKQIGVRQESSKLGGIGSCGRELCCSTWLSNYKSVSTVTARNQQLSLNPNKLAGQCGKLKCCLNFEFDIYNEELRKFPDNRPLKLKNDTAYFVKMDILRGQMLYTMHSNPQNYVSLDREQVEQIQKLNNKNIFPDSFETNVVEKPAVQFDNVIGQDDIKRFDSNSNNKNKKKKKKNGGGQRNGDEPRVVQNQAQNGNSHQIKKPNTDNNNQGKNILIKKNQQNKNDESGQNNQQP